MRALSIYRYQRLPGGPHRPGQHGRELLDRGAGLGRAPPSRNRQGPTGRRRQPGIGGTAANTGNLIAGTASAGIDVINMAQSVQIEAQSDRHERGGHRRCRRTTATLGIFLTNADNTIIGGSTADGNVVSGSSAGGSAPGCAGNSGNTVRGNLIGTNAAGTAAIPNGIGIALGGPGTVIGGGSADDGNTISGNTGAGITFTNTGVDHDGTTVYGNRIGTNAAGTAAVANGTGGSSPRVAGAGAGPRIGSTGSGQGNLISGNTGDGVAFQVSGQPRAVRDLLEQPSAWPPAGARAAQHGGDRGAELERCATTTRSPATPSPAPAERIAGLQQREHVQGNLIGTSNVERRLRQPGQRRVRRPGAPTT